MMSSKSGLLLTIFSPLILFFIVGGDFLIRNAELKWWHGLVMIFCFGMSIVGLWNVKNGYR